MKWLKRLFNKKKNEAQVRDKLVEMYGEEAGVCYDKMCDGIPIEGFLETAVFLNMVEEARRLLKKE